MREYPVARAWADSRVQSIIGPHSGDIDLAYGSLETPAGAGDQCRRSGQFLRWHADSLDGYGWWPG
jgi:hypothetical protein